jgi:uncharacterized protein YecE (DUF72 family)
MKTVLIGTSGYNYKDWKGIFYPEDIPQKQWLSYFSQQFSTVEINATFYGSFTQKTFKKWAGQVPDDFQFTIKGSRFLTHIKRLKDSKDSLEKFVEASSGLGKKLSCMLWQLPGNFHFKRKETVERLEEFFSFLPVTTRQVFELRHDSWFVEEVYALLRKYNVGFVINDSSRYPWREEMTADFVYIRFHGPRQLYASKYSEEEMENWAEKIKEYRKSYDVYCYFNNDFFGYAIENARQLLQLLS